MRGTRGEPGTEPTPAGWRTGSRNAPDRAAAWLVVGAFFGLLTLVAAATGAPDGGVPSALGGSNTNEPVPNESVSKEPVPDRGALENPATEGPGAVQTVPGEPVSRQPGAQFATACEFDHTAVADPITDDDHSHLHDFFGNSSAARGSTYDSLRGAATSCYHGTDRSAYWVPAIKWDGQRLVPSRASIYYRAADKDHARVRPHPPALKVISGGREGERRVTWSCGRGDKTSTQAPPRRCEGGTLAATVYFPDCWDGRNLDGADHRSHLKYAQTRGGERRCPGSHPVPLPGIDATFFYDLPADDPSGRTLVSTGHDSWDGPDSYHADFFNAWDQDGLAKLVQECVNETGPTDPLPDRCRNREPRRPPALASVRTVPNSPPSARS